MALYQLNLAVTVPDGKVVEMRDVVSEQFGWTATINNPNYNLLEWLDPPDNTVPNPNYDPNPTIANPLTKQQWIDNFLLYHGNIWLRNMLINSYREGKNKTIEELNVTT